MERCRRFVVPRWNDVERVAVVTPFAGERATFGFGGGAPTPRTRDTPRDTFRSMAAFGRRCESGCRGPRPPLRVTRRLRDCSWRDRSPEATGSRKGQHPLHIPRVQHIGCLEARFACDTDAQVHVGQPLR